MRNADFPFSRVVLPLIATALLIVIWHYSAVLFDVPAYLIPGPLDVAMALKAGLIDGTLWPHIWATLSAFVLGYLTGCAAAFVSAAIISESSLLEKALYPIIVAFQAVPKVALAPVIIVWFGFGIESKVVLVALICFFPAFLNTLLGLNSYSRNLGDLYRVFGANRLQIFMSVKLPAAAPVIFAGLEISVVLALLGVVMSELVASRAGLGHVIQSSGMDFNISMMFACVIVLAVMGVLASQVVVLVRRWVVFWERLGRGRYTRG